MKIEEALKIIEDHESGFMISFELREGRLLKSDYFPDKHAGELLIKTEEEAWELAERFADATDESYVNIYVIDHTFSPVTRYSEKVLKKY